MSACNILPQPGRRCVHLITDGVATRTDGTVHAIGAKIWTVASGRAALAFRGGVGPWVNWVPTHLEGAPSFDACVRWMADYAPKCHRLALDLNPKRVGQHACMEASLVGWSESAAEAQAWFMTSHPSISGHEHLAPYEMERTTSPRGAPAVPDVLAAIGLPATPSWDEVDALDPELAAIGWVTAQRHTTDAASGWPHHSVGGFVEIATVSSGGLTRRIVKRWPDAIGDKIHP